MGTGAEHNIVWSTVDRTDIDEAEPRRLVRDRYGVVISGAHAELVGKVIRIGHMGTAFPRAIRS